MARVMLIIGGNMGDVAQSIAAVRELITQRVGGIVAQSSVLESEAWGVMEEGSEGVFLNQVLAVDTTLKPMELMRITQDIERELGRVRGQEGEDNRELEGYQGVAGEQGPRVYRSRTMDIDILLYDELIVDLPELKIPHPMIAEREFVLRPLSEIAPHYKHPKSGVTVVEMLNRLVEAERVKKKMQ